MPVSKFKATCLSVLKRVQRTGRPVLVTRFGQPVAEVIPPQRRGPRLKWLGAMEGRAKIVGDIVKIILAAALLPTGWKLLNRKASK